MHNVLLEGGKLSMNVKQVTQAILMKACGMRRIQPTCDRLVYGSEEMEVTGIVTTFMATADVIKQAAELGANMIVTHEPTWFTGADNEDWCRNDSVYRAKRELLMHKGMAVWRFHDHMHMCDGPDLIYDGVVRQLGWQQYQTTPDSPWLYDLPKMTLRELCRDIKQKLDMEHLQVIGDPDMMCGRILLLVGGGSLGLGREEMPMEEMEKSGADVMVCGDITEWTTCAYINDAAQLGMRRAMIKLGHERSEEGGMKYLVPWLSECLPGVPVHFIDAKEPFQYL